MRGCKKIIIGNYVRSPTDITNKWGNISVGRIWSASVPQMSQVRVLLSPQFVYEFR